MADRPGDPDAAVVREALRWRSDLHAHEADAALGRIEARLSEAERCVNCGVPQERWGEVTCFPGHEHLDAHTRLSVYEQALRQIAEPMPDREGDWGSETDDWERVARAYRGIARAALTTEPGHV